MIKNIKITSNHMIKTELSLLSNNSSNSNSVSAGLSNGTLDNEVSLKNVNIKNSELATENFTIAFEKAFNDVLTTLENTDNEIANNLNSGVQNV